jgi:hypothetical protein
MKRFQIVREYNVCGNVYECLCHDLGPAIVYGEEKAKDLVQKLHDMGHASARYEELPQGAAWFDNENWIG